MPIFAAMIWGDSSEESALSHEHYDVICGSDTLLFGSSYIALLRFLRRLSLASTVVLIERDDR